MAVILSGTTNDILVNGVSVATDAEVSSAVASAVAPKANTADLKEIGVNQTLQDLTASRVSGATYTNSTGKPIFLLVFSTNGNFSGTLNINGISVNYGSATDIAYAMQSVQIIVPNNNTYSVTFTDAGTAHKWLELR